MLPAKPTSRKFYNKWLYKITLCIGGASVLRYELSRVHEYCNEDRANVGHWTWQNRAAEDKEFILNLVGFLISKDKSIWSKRVERNFVDFYTSDKAFFNELSQLAAERIRHRFEPTGQSLDILEISPTSIAVEKYPHDRYKHKVYLLPHKMNGNIEEKTKYISWLQKQVPKLTCTEAIANWFLKTDWNWDRRYILVEDEAMLLMLKLRNSEVMGRVYNYVLCDK